MTLVIVRTAVSRVRRTARSGVLRSPARVPFSQRRSTGGDVVRRRAAPRVRRPAGARGEHVSAQDPAGRGGEARTGRRRGPVRGAGRRAAQPPTRGGGRDRRTGHGPTRARRVRRRARRSPVATRSGYRPHRPGRRGWTTARHAGVAVGAQWLEPDATVGVKTPSHRSSSRARRVDVDGGDAVEVCDRAGRAGVHQDHADPVSEIDGGGTCRPGDAAASSDDDVAGDPRGVEAAGRAEPGASAAGARGSTRAPTTTPPADAARGGPSLEEDGPLTSRTRPSRTGPLVAPTVKPTGQDGRRAGPGRYRPPPR